MTRKIIAAIGALAVVSTASVALAQGHVAGAVVGAAAGAPSHHAVAGAVVGGAVGHHMVMTKAKKQGKAPK